MQDLVGVGVADAAEERRIGERAFERVIAPLEHRQKLLWAGREHIEAARIMFAQFAVAPHHVQRRAALAARFRQQERAVFKIKGGKLVFSRQPCAGRFPVQSSGDHQVQHEPQLIIQPDGNPLAQSPQLANGLAVSRFQRWLTGSQQERAFQADLLQALTHDAAFKCIKIDRNIGQLGHRTIGRQRSKGRQSIPSLPMLAPL